MKISVSELTDFSVLSVEGEINLYNINEIRGVLEKLLKDLTKNVVLNMKNVYSIDSTGIAVLFATQKKVEALRKKFYLSNIEETVYNIISVTGIKFDTIELADDE